MVYNSILYVIFGANNSLEVTDKIVPVINLNRKVVEVAKKSNCILTFFLHQEISHDERIIANAYLLASVLAVS